MAYLNDTEKRLLFAALHREKGICKAIDKQKSDGILLTPFVESLERKFYYDRFEKEIRAKAIDDVNELAEEYEQSESGFVNELIDFLEENINAEKQIAEDGESREVILAHQYAARQYETLKWWIESRAKKSNQDWKDSMLNKFDGREV